MNTRKDSKEEADKEPLHQHDLCRIHVCSALTGYTIKAIERKIATHVWEKGTHYFKAPDKRILMHMPAIYQWMRGG